MDIEIERLGKSLRLTDGEDVEYVAPRMVWNDTNQRAHLAVVGRLLTKKSFNYDALVSTMKSVWNPGKGFESVRIGSDRILFQFNHILDKRRALFGGPWTFDKNLIVLNGLDGKANPATVSLDWCSFFVRIHDIPFFRQTKAMAEFIGNCLGKFEDLDLKGTWGAFMRIKVSLNVTKPLKRAMKIRGDDDEVIIVTFSYERLPNFCYLCGRLGHIERECELRYDIGVNLDPDNLPYGQWLREGGGMRKGGSFSSMPQASHANGSSSCAQSVSTPVQGNAGNQESGKSVGASQMSKGDLQGLQDRNLVGVVRSTDQNEGIQDFNDNGGNGYVAESVNELHEGGGHLDKDAACERRMNYALHGDVGDTVQSFKARDELVQLDSTASIG